MYISGYFGAGGYFLGIHYSGWSDHRTKAAGGNAEVGKWLPYLIMGKGKDKNLGRESQYILCNDTV